MISEAMTELSLDSSFTFRCAPGISCFNSCCRDLNQFLTPYDILRLKRHFGMTSSDFLRRYTAVHTGPQTGLPVVTLKPKEKVFLTCPFVVPEGCLVYENRPSSCRIYPLIRFLSQSRATGESSARYMLLKEPHCKGFNCDESQTVRQWMTEQGLYPYNEMNDSLMALIILKNQLVEKHLPKSLAGFFYTACYDLDRFRRGLIDGEPIAYAANRSVPEPDKASDEDLLRFGLDVIAEKIRQAAGKVEDEA